MAPAWGFRRKFPTQRNRELFRRSREFWRGNREFYFREATIKVSVHFSHTCSAGDEHDLFSSSICSWRDGRIELDNNTVERAIRPIALGRKNYLCAGSDGGAARWTTVASLLATAKLNDVEPFASLKDVPELMSDGHPMSRLDDLLPWNWT